MIHPDRIEVLNQASPKKDGYVLYWMEASQREEYNHALEYAAAEANRMNAPLVAVYGLPPRKDGATLRRFAFLLDGLMDVQKSLYSRGVQLAVLKKSPDKACLHLAEEARLVVTDRGYLRHQKAWRAAVAGKIACPLVQVESNVIVPLERASIKEEYSAGTLRPKINRNIEEFLFPVTRIPLKKDSLGLKLDSLDLSAPDSILKGLRLNRKIKPSPLYQGGASQANKRLKGFIGNRLENYDPDHSDPGLEGLSHLSPYLHFGQISPLKIALEADEAPIKNSQSKASFLEELIVRRELSMNFVHFNPAYDTYDSVPQWARSTLDDHRYDKREYEYSLEEWEAAKTHDPYWNAAQQEMTITGKMHGYMRMYWAKKILEWSKSPEEAFRIALLLNDQYELDGEDPNGYAGVAWCFGKHDRAWGERPVYGKVRSMVASGLRRKFHIQAYVEKVEKLQAP